MNYDLELNGWGTKKSWQRKLLGDPKFVVGSGRPSQIWRVCGLLSNGYFAIPWAAIRSSSHPMLKALGELIPLGDLEEDGVWSSDDGKAFSPAVAKSGGPSIEAQLGDARDSFHDMLCAKAVTDSEVTGLSKIDRDTFSDQILIEGDDFWIPRRQHQLVRQTVFAGRSVPVYEVIKVGSGASWRSALVRVGGEALLPAYEWR